MGFNYMFSAIGQSKVLFWKKFLAKDPGEGVSRKYTKGTAGTPIIFATSGSTGDRKFVIQTPRALNLNIRYNDNVPQQVGDEVECEIHYKLADGESTTLIVKLVVLKTTDEYLWLWNEFQKVGMIVQRI